MALVSLPSDSPHPTVCVLCDVRLAPDKATAGLLDAEGRQTFACVSHFSEPQKLILGWADFMANQRHEYLHRGIEPQELVYGTGGSDAQFAS